MAQVSKNIAFIHKKFPFGGAEVVTINVISSLQKYGYNFFIFTCELNKDTIPDGFSDVKYIVLPYPINDRRNIPFLTSQAQLHSIDIFVSSGGSAIPYLAELKENVPSKIVYACHSAPFWETIYKIESGKHRAATNLFKWMEWYLLRSLKFKCGIFQKSLRKRYLNLYNSVDAFGVLCDEYGQEFAHELDIDYNSSKFVTLTNAAYPNPNFNKDKSKEVCFIGRLSHADKRVDRLLRIWQLVEQKDKEWILNIVGDGPEMENLKQQARDLHIERVFFRGFTPNPKEYYDRAAIVCMTSAFEGWPMVLLEAQANGCATIAFDCCAGVRAILSPTWENGVLIEPNDIDAYAEALLRLINDGELRKRIARNGQRHVAEFSEEHTAQQWVNMINRLLQ